MPPSVLAMIEETIMAAVISEKVLSPRKHKMDLALMALSVLLGAGGIFFLGVALDRYLSANYSGELAALAAGMATLFIAVTAGLIARASHEKKRSVIGAARSELGRNIRQLIEDVSEELDDPVKDNPKTAVLLAALAGFFTANAATKH